MLSETAKSYIEKRGWIKRDYTSIGAFSEDDNVFFPLKAYNNDIVGEAGRNLHKREFIIRLQRKTFGYFVWRGIRPNKVIFIVEGIFDLGWLLQNDFHAAACLSNALNKAQLRTVARFYDGVVLLPDNDSAGSDGSKRTTYDLKRLGVKNVVSFTFKGFKDLGKAFESENNTSVVIDQLHFLEKGFE